MKQERIKFVQSPEVEERDGEAAVAPQIPPPPFISVDTPQVLTKKREVMTPERLSAKEASKRLLPEERKQLVEQILQKRKDRFAKLSDLKTRSELLKTRLSFYDIQNDAGLRDYDNLSGFRAEQANSFADAIREDRGSNEMNVGDEIKNLELLLESDNYLDEIKRKLAEHYSKAEILSKEYFENHQKTVEQTILRNNVFFVHTINEHPELRHNDNSSVSKGTIFEDDLDILLSLEPSISVSSVNPGKDVEGNVSALWSYSGGVLLGGGQIAEAHRVDAGSISVGIKKRRSVGAEKMDFPIEEIDEIAKKRGGSIEHDGRNIGTYNEFVVNNPEIFGYFQPAERDESGNHWAYDLGTKKQLEALHKAYRPGIHDFHYQDLYEIFQGNIQRYRDKIGLTQNKGLPHYIITKDRHFFECFGVNDNGTLQIGKELIPDEVAKGRAGLSSAKRKGIGARLLNRSIFKKEETKREAESIIKKL